MQFTRVSARFTLLYAGSSAKSPEATILFGLARRVAGPNLDICLVEGNIYGFLFVCFLGGERVLSTKESRWNQLPKGVKTTHVFQGLFRA